MKSLSCELTNSTTTVYGDTTKTYLAGRATPSTFMGKDVVAPGLTTFADVNTTFGIVPGHCIVNPATGRKFELQNATTNTPTVLAFNFNLATGVWSYIGKVILTLPIGVHTYRGFSFDDSNPSNIKLMVSSTVTTSLFQGGTYYTWNLALADFTVAGTTIFMATSTNQKAVYFAQYAGQVGLNHVGTTSGGVGSGVNLVSLANRTKFFQQNGTAALPQIYVWDTSLGNPSVDGTVTNGISSQTTLYAGTSPAAFFRMGASQNGYSTTAPIASAAETVIVQNGTTNVPTNLTATPINTAQTVYFIRDLQFVGGIWYFNLSSAAGGVAITPATNSATFTMMRASGVTTSHSVLKTGNITPALTGTLLQTHSFGCTTPVNVPLAPALNNQDCLFITTSTTLYLGLISDLVDGSTTWGSNTPANMLGTGLDIVVPSILLARYSSYLDRWVYVTNTSKFVMKKHQNNSIDKVFGALSNIYYELQNLPSVPLGMAAITTINVSGGWLFVAGSTTGQRGVISCDLYSDDSFGVTYIVSKVLKVPFGSKLRFFTTDEAATDFTGDLVIYVRSANTSTDPVFSSASGGWVSYDPYQDQAPASLGPYFQVKLAYEIIKDNNTSPAQLHDFVVAYDEPGEIDKHFTWSHERTSKAGDSPMIVSVRQVEQLAFTPTKFILTGQDDAGNSVVTIDSSVTPAVFAQTLNSGSSYVTFTNMATFISTYNSGSGNTELKITVASPPAIPYVTWSFKYA